MARFEAFNCRTRGTKGTSVKHLNVDKVTSAVSQGEDEDGKPLWVLRIGETIYCVVISEEELLEKLNGTKQ